MRIALIGPAYPYKGGISHYTGLLYKALVKQGQQVFLHSFKFQYPSLLYHKEQKDERNPQFKIENINYSIHTMNPLNWLSAARKIRKDDPELVIFQWWHPYFVPCFWSLCKLLRKRKVLFICHNVFPHERFPMDRFLAKLMLRQGDYFIAQSRMDAEDLLSVKSDASYVVTPHPTYNAFKIKNLSMKEARQILKIQDQTKTLLFFGFVREYKGLKYLLQAMPEIREKVSDTQLWIVGDFGSDKDEYMKLIRELDIGEQIKVVGGYIADTEVEKYFAASDLVVLPYISATQSGIVQIAYGLERPVLVTDVGGLPDVVTDRKTGYVVEPQSPHAIAEAVQDFFEQNRAEEFAANIREEEERFSWSTFADKLVDLVGKG